jgi:hypothetical protein
MGADRIAMATALAIIIILGLYVWFIAGWCRALRRTPKVNENTIGEKLRKIMEDRI